MAKRKRNEDHVQRPLMNGSGKSKFTQLRHGPNQSKELAIQLITGSYERVLHGFVATIRPAPSSDGEQLTSTHTDVATERASATFDTSFSDTFLFAAHSSSVRCLALSHHPESKKCILATGGADERINLYSIATTLPSRAETGNKLALPSLSNTAIAENPRNRELGSLMHHSRAITKLYFPTNGKFFSAGEDNAIAISRTRDWTVLSTIKAPIPKPVGRPSGDTAGPGEVPAGVNDFAIHPSMKLMMSVGRGERCMRLWNLVTGKKAGVLNFEKDLLRQVGEGKHDTGEGRKVIWARSGEEFVVCFERGAAIFGIDCKARAIIRADRPTKFHQVRLVPQVNKDDAAKLLAISTEDGRVLFYDCSTSTESTEVTLPAIVPYAQLVGSRSRIKDFSFLQIPDHADLSLLCVTGSSDGNTCIWSLANDLISHAKQTITKTDTITQAGKLVATHTSMNRITCLEAFVMDTNSRGDEVSEGSSDENDFGGFSSNDDQN